MFVSQALRNAMLDALKASMDGGFIYIYAGTVPASADAALDMVATHTQLAKIAADAVPVDAGVTGLTFAAAAVAGAIAKNGAETWAGKINFVGKDAAQAGVGPLTATFFRFCTAADNGQAAGDNTTPRIQGTVGTSGTDVVLDSADLNDNGANTTGLATFEVRQPAG